MTGAASFFSTFLASLSSPRQVTTAPPRSSTPLVRRTTLQPVEGILANAPTVSATATHCQAPAAAPDSGKERWPLAQGAPGNTLEMQGPRPHPDLLSQSVCEQDPRRLVLKYEAHLAWSRLSRDTRPFVELQMARPCPVTPSLHVGRSGVQPANVSSAPVHADVAGPAACFENRCLTA